MACLLCRLTRYQLSRHFALEDPLPRPYPLGMSTDQTLPANDATARRNVWVLVAAQAILGAQMPMVFTIAGLAGQSLASNPCWATLPISFMVIGSMLTATPLSALMQKHGRRAGFAVGAVGGMIGGAVGAWGLNQHSFLAFLIGALFTGVDMSARVLELKLKDHQPVAINLTWPANGEINIDQKLVK